MVILNEFADAGIDVLTLAQSARSGAGHAADIVDELSVYEKHGALRLGSVVCRVDPQDAGRILGTHDPGEWSQIQSADVLLMSKSDLAVESDRRAFAEIVQAQYPGKRHVDATSGGALPAGQPAKRGSSGWRTLLQDAALAPG